MSDLLGQLYRLQTRIQFVRDRERKRDTVPPELSEVVVTGTRLANQFSP